MAAPTLSEKVKTLRGSLIKGKQKSRKNVLKSPYNISWPIIDEDVQLEILKRLQDTLIPLHLAKPKHRAWVRKDKEKQQPNVINSESEETKHARSQLVIGVNAVTRAVEKDRLGLVLVCRSTQPAIITKHLIQLTASRNCPALCLYDLSETLKLVLNLTSAAVCGFKKVEDTETDVFGDLVNEIKQHAIRIPFLNSDENEPSHGIPIDQSEQSSADQDLSISVQSLANTSICTETKDNSKSSPVLKDYSYLYVYKSDLIQSNKARKSNFGDDFVAFDDNVDSMSDVSSALVDVATIKHTAEKVNMETHSQCVALKRKRVEAKDRKKAKKLKRHELGQYKNVVVKQMMPNPNKRKNKKFKK